MNTKTNNGWGGMPAEEFPDHASGVRDLDKRAGLQVVAWLCFALCVALLVAFLILCAECSAKAQPSACMPFQSVPFTAPANPDVRAEFDDRFVVTNLVVRPDYKGTIQVSDRFFHIVQVNEFYLVPGSR